MRRFLKRLFFRVYRNDLEQIRVEERLRIWEDIYQRCSVIPYSEPTKGGGIKTTHIIKIGEPALRSIILPELPKWYVEHDKTFEVLPPIHKSLKA